MKTIGVFKDFLSKLFSKTKRGGVIEISNYSDAELNFAIESFAVFTTIEMIASLLSKCEFKTYDKFKELRGYEWYSLNIKPNKNQNATQFWHEVYCKLLYYQEVLIVDIGGQKIIADDFNMKENAIIDSVFSEVSRGDITFNRTFNSSEVLYMKYANSNVKSLISNVFGLYNKLISEASDKYIKSGGQKGVLNVDTLAKGEPDFEDKFADLMKNKFKSYFTSKNAVLPLWKGLTYVPQTTDNVKKSTSEITDIKSLVDDAMSRVAQAYKIPPALVRGEVAGLKDAFDIMLTVCIDPLANMASEEMTSKLFKVKDVIDGSYIEADTTCIKHIDIFDIATNIDKLISCGFASIDEAREKAGMTAIKEDWSEKHWITKNYQDIENYADTGDANLKGGENNEE